MTETAMSTAGARRWTIARIPDLSGRTAIVTGGSAGIGFETARRLAEHGASVVLACRNIDKTERAAGRIRAENKGGVINVVHLDLASLASVREAASELRAACPHVDLLVNNAGVMEPPMSAPRTALS
jgi:NAD(P)-dependent dehydrogenase (short-subunit alcohol dehydrogenase family)